GTGYRRSHVPRRPTRACPETTSVASRLAAAWTSSGLTPPPPEPPRSHRQSISSWRAFSSRTPEELLLDAVRIVPDVGLEEAGLLDEPELRHQGVDLLVGKPGEHLDGLAVRV